MKDNALYLEADEDITSAIDKLSRVPASAVQIVVPKRSGLLQSIINLKLLKKAADNSGKTVVLVTNDRVANDLAARVGLAVAPAVGGKAVLSEAKAAPVLNTDDEVIEATDPAPTAAQLASTDLPPAAAAASAKKPFIRRREVPDDPAPASAAAISGAAVSGAASPADAPTAPVPAATAPGAEAPVPDAGRSRPRVPNYRKLQRRLLWLGLAVVLVGGYVGTMYFMMSAKVILYANATKTSVDTSFTVDPSATASDTANGALAGQQVTFTKDLTGPFTPTGKKDAGAKATGSMTIVNNDTASHDFVAGTRFTAPDGKVFRTNADVHIDPATASIVNHAAVINPTNTNVSVTADQNGDSYNEGPAKYTIPGLAPDQQQYTYGQGAQMSGGVTKTVTVVQQSDVDAAVAALIDKDQDASARDLASKTGSGAMALTASQAHKTSDITTSPAVDSEADAATVSFKVTYTMLTVKKTDYEAAMKALETKQVGAANQIYDDGLAAAQITLAGTDAAGKTSFNLATDAYSGATIDTAALIKNLAGKRYGDAMDLAARQPSVSHCEINLWPGWSASLPLRTSKITVTIKVASGQK